ncbi:hypothetical protein E2C01_101813 [Portunus trituberculatus]|uniref:Uncharacterized protein n=1 Tax=Portunus trituberculatus TaxID=210409 RepID=A0A5B7KGT5_PORTR|nr:hypothetical protein [Portunus trituberculatus]
MYTPRKTYQRPASRLPATPRAQTNNEATGGRQRAESGRREPRRAFNAHLNGKTDGEK